jgi:hypothetical protein
MYSLTKMRLFFHFGNMKNLSDGYKQHFSCIKFHWGEDWRWRRVHGTFHEPSPIFYNLVMSLEFMSTKDVDLQFIIARLFHEVSKRKESANTKNATLLNKTHKVNEKLCFYWNNLKTSKKWKLQGSWNGTIVLTNKKITKVKNATITKLWFATTNKGWRFYVHSKTMKGENERQLKNTPLYIIS